MAERGVSKKMIDLTVKKGLKYWDPKNKSVVHVLKNGMASGKHMQVAVDPITKNIKTVINNSSKLPKRFVPIE